MLRTMFVTSMVITVAFGTGLTAAESPNVHLEGCVYYEETMSTQRPGSSDGTLSYILTDTKILAGSANESAILKLEAVDERSTRTLVGKRVGVTGRVDDADGMPELRVVSIREIVGGCRPSATTAS